MTADRPGFDSAALSPDQERALQRLAFAIEAGQGRFKLLIARCNYGDLVDRLLVRLQTLCEVEVRRLVLQPGDRQLFAAIERAINSDPPGALAVVGFGGLTDGDLRELFAQANRSREAFRDRFPLPLVWWLDDRSLQQLQNTASDLASWATSQTFAATPIELAAWVRSVAQQALDQLWATQPQPIPDVPIAELLNHQIAIATQDWQNAIASPLELAPDQLAETQIHLAWLAAIAQPTDPAAREQYEQAIGFWDERGDGARSGALRILLGEWWRSRALLSRRHYEPYLAEARDQFAAAIAAFDQADRPDLSAKFINAWGGILQRLAAWDDLKPVAQRALELHDRYPNPFKRARACGLWGQLALIEQDWAGAIGWLDAALLAAEEANFEQWQLPGDAESLGWVQTTNQALHRFLRAQAKRELGDHAGSLADLQAAIDHTQPDYEPRLYIQILVALADLYRDHRDYRQAFETKLLRQEIEQQFNFRAFVGAGRLQAGRLQRLGGSLGGDRAMPLEIAAAGRSRDVERIWQRLANDRGDAITVLFGFSGSGKSSLLNAGIIPLLQRRSLGQRDGLPVVMRDYTDWEQGLWAALQQALGDRGAIEPPTDGHWQKAIARELVRNAEQRNLATVLIFDQFEEFFFEHGQRQGRSPLFAFLSQCLDITGLKIIFSIRREYIYYLLNRAELDQRIDGGLLSTHVLYRIGNFRLEEAKQVIRDLIDRAELDWEPELIEAIVSDLSGRYYKVRPIELQIVGAQVQAEGITTAAGYANSGGKVALVQRYLDAATGDCGPENVELATFILFLLTGDKTIRPLKTRAVLQEELASLIQGGDRALPDQDLDLVLEILVGSGLLLQNVSQAEPTYQLVHDYIAEFIREQQMPDLLAQMQAEREKRQVAERQLSEIQASIKQADQQRKWTNQQLQKVNQQLKRARKILIGSFIFTVVIISASIMATSYLIELQLAASIDTEVNLALAQEDKFTGLIRSMQLAVRLKNILKTDRDLKSYPTISPIYAVDSLLRSLGIRNRLNSKSYFLNAKFLPKERLIITNSSDGKIRFWDLKGNLLQTFTGHEHRGVFYFLDSDKKIKKIEPNSQSNSLRITENGYFRDIGSSLNGSVNIYDSGKDLTTTLSLEPNSTSWIVSAIFSPSGRSIVTLDHRGNIVFWSLQGKKIKSFKTQELTNENGSHKMLNLSSDEQKIITVSNDGWLTILSGEGDRLARFNIFQRKTDFVKQIAFMPNNQKIITTSAIGGVRIWDLSGRLVQDLGFSSIDFSRDKSAIAYSNGKISIFDLRNWKALKSIQESTSEIRFIRFSSDGKRLIISLQNNTGKIWDLNKGALTEIPSNQNIALSADSQKVVIGLENSIEIRDLNRRLLQSFQGSSAVLSPDGSKILINKNSSVMILPVATLDNVLSRGCAWLRDYLTTNRDAPEDLQQFCRVKPSQKP